MHLSVEKKVERICSLVLHIHGPKPVGFFLLVLFLVLKTVKRPSFFKLEEIHNDGPDEVSRALFVLGGLGYASDSIPRTKLQQIPLQNLF